MLQAGLLELLCLLLLQIRLQQGTPRRSSTLPDLLTQLQPQPKRQEAGVPLRRSGLPRTSQTEASPRAGLSLPHEEGTDQRAQKEPAPHSSHAAAPARRRPVHAGCSRTRFPQRPGSLLIWKIWHSRRRWDGGGRPARRDSELRAGSRTDRFPPIAPDAAPR